MPRDMGLLTVTTLRDYSALRVRQLRPLGRSQDPLGSAVDGTHYSDTSSESVPPLDGNHQDHTGLTALDSPYNDGT